MKHTTGPWKVEQYMDRPSLHNCAYNAFRCRTENHDGLTDCCYAPRGHVKILQDTKGSQIEVASVTTKSGYDARLIAAAPELLAALKFLVSAAETEPGMSIYKAHIDQALAAIAKAEGGTP